MSNLRVIKDNILSRLRLDNTQLNDDDFINTAVVTIHHDMMDLKLPFLRAVKVIDSSNIDGIYETSLEEINATEIDYISDNFYKANCFSNVESGVDGDNGGYDGFQYAQIGERILIRTDTADVINIHYFKALETDPADIDLDTYKVFGFIQNIYITGALFYIKEWQRAENFGDYEAAYRMALKKSRAKQAKTLISL